MTIKKSESETETPVDEMVFNNHEVVSSIFHEKKQLILEKLIEKEMTIYALKTELGMNPGEIKRHITDLLNNGLITLTKEKRNKRGMFLKYYRSKAKRFVVHLTWGID